MKFKERSIYNVKAGDIVRVYCDGRTFEGKVIGVSKRRGIFMYGTVFHVQTNHWAIGTMVVWGRHMSNGTKYPAEKLLIGRE